jgi:tetratricopeptide (TPR) repeat protein
VAESIRIFTAIMLAAVFLAGCGGEDPSTVLYDRAKAAFDNKEYEAAITLCDEIILNHPDSEILEDAKELKLNGKRELLFDKSKEMANAGRFDEAGELLVELAAISKDDVKSNYGIGWIYLQMANAFAAEAMSVHPAMRGELALMSGAYIELAKYRFERCVEIDENDVYGHKGMALYYYSTNDQDKALEEIDKAIENAPDDTEKISTRGLRATILAQKEDFDASKAEIDKLAEDFPDRGEVYLSLAEYHLRKDMTDFEKPLDAVNTGLEKEIEDEATKGRMLSLKAQLMTQTGDFEGAMEALKAALNIDPLNQSYLDTFTLVYAQSEFAKE